MPDLDDSPVIFLDHLLFKISAISKRGSSRKMLLSFMVHALFLSLASSVYAVDITFTSVSPGVVDDPMAEGEGETGSYNRNDRLAPFAGGNPFASSSLSNIRQGCQSILPGICCKPRISPAGQIPPAMAALLGSQDPPTFNRVTFTRLEITDIAAAWVPRGRVEGCSGMPKETRWGPGTWTYDLPAGGADAKLSGANYIRVNNLQPKGPTVRARVVRTGLLGFVWSSGSQFASNIVGSARESLLSLADAQLKGRPMQKRTPNPHIRAVDRGVEKGVVFCQAPTEKTWVNTIALNGTEFVIEAPGSDIYISSDGQILNYTENAS